MTWRIFGVLCMACVLTLSAAAQGQQQKIRVLFVGGDWKSQLPEFNGTAMRGYFVRDAVEKAAPGRFEFTLWTSYEFLQYGDSQTLGQFDVLMVGDIMGQSVTPRLVKAMDEYVRAGGGFWYCDNHKAFSFYAVEKSFDSVLPIAVRPFRPYEPGVSQPQVSGEVKVVAESADHPVLKGLDLASAPPLTSARYGDLHENASVIAKAGSGEPIWVVREVGRGRTLWTGGVFSSDESSAKFATWPQIGQFYAQGLAWLAENAPANHQPLAKVTADGTLTVSLKKTGPELTSKHFGIHGQETARGARPMTGADLELYKALNLDGTFARTSAYMGIKRKQDGRPQEMLDDGTDLTQFDPDKYDWEPADAVVADLKRINAEALFLYWVPWKRTDWELLDPARWTKYFAASIEHVNGTPGRDYQQNFRYFEIMNEPELGPSANMSHDDVMKRFFAFINHTTTKLSERYPGMLFGVGGFYEYSYLQRVMEACGKNLAWISRHPYGHTGEAVFQLHDEYAAYADSLGLTDLKFIISEWDFWVYGEPAFDYIMQRWKPLAERADRVVGTLHYRWREYLEGGYVFGVHGEHDPSEGRPYGVLPAEWPNPGRNKPITYRYNAFWAMRHARGQQHEVTLDIPALKVGEAQRAWAIATSNAEQFNIVIYYGYPQPDLEKKQEVQAIKLHVRSAIPEQVKGRTLVISRADARQTIELPPQQVDGDQIDLVLDLPAQTAISLTLR